MEVIVEIRTQLMERYPLLQNCEKEIMEGFYEMKKASSRAGNC